MVVCVFGAASVDRPVTLHNVVKYPPLLYLGVLDANPSFERHPELSFH